MDCQDQRRALLYMLLNLQLILDSVFNGFQTRERYQVRDCTIIMCYLRLYAGPVIAIQSLLWDHLTHITRNTDLKVFVVVILKEGLGPHQSFFGYDTDYRI